MTWTIRLHFAIISFAFPLLICRHKCLQPVLVLVLVLVTVPEEFGVIRVSVHNTYRNNNRSSHSYVYNSFELRVPVRRPITCPEAR
eukprot:scaffold430773_cov36-Prasinocladus_malaysianus.AAC.1